MPFDRAGFLNSFGGFGNHDSCSNNESHKKSNDAKLLKKELHYVETYIKSRDTSKDKFSNRSCNDNYGFGGSSGCGAAFGGGFGRFGGCRDDGFYGNGFYGSGGCGPVCDTGCDIGCGPVCDTGCDIGCDIGGYGGCGSGKSYGGCGPGKSYGGYGKSGKSIKPIKPIKIDFDKKDKKDKKDKNDSPCNPECKPCYKPVCYEPIDKVCGCDKCRKSFRKIYD